MNTAGDVIGGTIGAALVPSLAKRPQVATMILVSTGSYP